jgi:hypothetical protein
MNRWRRALAGKDIQLHDTTHDNLPKVAGNSLDNSIYQEGEVPTHDNNCRVHTRKKAGKQLELLPSCFSLYFVSLLNFDQDYFDEDSKLVKASWLEFNKLKTETIQDIFAAKYLTYMTSIWIGVMFICIVLGQGAMATINICDPVQCTKICSGMEETNWTYLPTPIMVAIYTMSMGLHAIMIPEIRSSLDMMKFVLNHPERFHHWKRAFLCAFMRTIMVFTIEITNSFRVLGRCEVILIVIGYISFTALLEVD